MLKEIGSEFWEVELNKERKTILEEHYKFLLTGRTVLDYIIKDIKINKHIKSIYMPSYCCHTMIQPFLDNSIDVQFYNVGFDNGQYTYEIDFDTNCDVVLIMQYFGFYNEEVEKSINQFKKYGKIIIEDATHSWFSQNPYSHKSDYVLASFRKWTGLHCGAIAVKRYDSFSELSSNRINYRYIQIRQQASELKKEYIENNKGKKEIFLKMFSEAENSLRNNYQDYRIPDSYERLITRLDIETIKTRRQENSKVLIEGLKNLKKIRILEITYKDVPLFVPIIVLEGKRDELRKYLIDHNIYSPVHWILSEEHRIDDTYLFDNSLSLICDQRYNLQDMERINELINEFYREEV